MNASSSQRDHTFGSPLQRSQKGTLSLDRIPHTHRPMWTFATITIVQLTFLCSTFADWMNAGVPLTGLIALVLYRGYTHEAESPLLIRPTLQTLTIAATILFSLLVMIVFRIPQSLTENSNFVLIGVDIVAHGSLLATILIWGLFPRRGHVTLLFLGMLLVLLCVAAGGVSRSLSAQTTVGLLACLGFVSAARVIVPLIQKEKAHVREQRHRKHHQLDALNLAATNGEPIRNERHKAAQQKRFRAGVATAVGFMMVTGAVANVTDKFLPGIQTNLQNQLESSIDAVQRQALVGGMGYVSGSRLGDVRDHLSSNPEGVALRVYSTQRPGYLRGTVFDSFHNGNWGYVKTKSHSGRRSKTEFNGREIDSTGPGIVPLKSKQNFGLKRFPFRDPENQTTSILEIHGQSHRGNKAFLPLSTRWLEMRSSGLTVNHHDVIELGVDVQYPYVAAASYRPPTENLQPVRRNVMTRLHKRYREWITAYAKQICADAKTPRDKAAAVSQFFQTKFRYGLGEVQRPPNTDPVKYFLETRHEAHCEYFATASALLLRGAQVPTRYVTGYVVDEFDSDDDYWIGRNRHAHAWVEAYDNETQTWFAVESTPGRSYFSVERKSNNAQQNSLTDSSETTTRQNKFGFLGTIWSYLTSIRATDVLFAVFRYGQMMILVGLVALFFRNVRARNKNPLDPEEQRSQRLLAKINRKLKSHGLIRAPGETLHRFADRIELSTNREPPTDKWDPEQIAIWLRAYANARYQGQTPPEFS